MNRFRSKLLLILAILFLLVVTPRAFADSTNVSVSVNGYAGRWTVDGTNRFIGDQIISLNSGTYNFQLINVENSYFQFSVDDSGNVTVSDPAVAAGGVGTLTLTTHAVDVDVSNYSGRWRSGADSGISTSRYRGNQTVYLPATTYSFSLINVTPDYFQYTVDVAGNVAVSDPSVATGGAGTLSLITHAVDVDVSNYSGRWRSGADDEISTSRYRENQTVYLPATTYSFNLVNVTPDYFQYTVDIAGNVAVSDPSVATGGAGSLTLITHTVEVDVSNYAGRWRSGADDEISTSRYRENQTVYLPATTYSFNLVNVTPDYFQYTVDIAGNVAVSDPSVATGGAGTLTIITYAVEVDVSSYSGRWRSGADNGISTTRYRENQMVYLPATTYSFSLINVTPDYFQYTVDIAGNVAVSDPSVATGGAGSLTLITHTVEVDVSNYAGRWRSGADDEISTSRYRENQTVYLPATTYSFSLINVTPDYFQYTVDTAGNVAASDPAVAAGGAGVLTLITHALDVDVSNYAGRWRSGADDEISTSRYRENQTVYLPATTYSFSLINVTLNYFQYTVDTAGNVAVSDPAVAAGGAGVLTLITHALDVDVSNYPGRWRSGADTVSSTRYLGDQTIYLAAATYRFALVNVVPTHFEYTVDTAGNVTVTDAHKAVPGGNQLTLVTGAIDIDPDGAPANWLFGDTRPALNGAQTLCLAPATYTFSMAESHFDYTVANSTLFYLFTVSPTSAPVTVDGTRYIVNLSLGPAGSGCFNLSPSAWDDLDRAIADAEIDVDGLRASLQAKASAARAAYNDGQVDTAGNILCALLSEVAAQKGVHIETASADRIRDTVINVAIALGIPLKCI